MSSHVNVVAMAILFCLVLISSGFSETTVSTEGELRSIMSEYQDSIDKSLLETQRAMFSRMDKLENDTNNMVSDNQAVVVERIKSQELKFLSVFTAFALFFVCGVGLVWSILLGTKWYSFKRYKKQVLEENKTEFVDLAAKKYKKEMHGKMAADIAQAYIEFASTDPAGFVEEHPEFARKIGLIWMKNKVGDAKEESKPDKNQEFDKFWRQK